MGGCGALHIALYSYIFNDLDRISVGFVYGSLCDFHYKYSKEPQGPGARPMGPAALRALVPMGPRGPIGPP